MRQQTLYELIFGKSSITIQVHPSDDTNDISCFSLVAVLSQKWFEIFNVYIAIGPIINLLEGFDIMELFVALEALFELFHDSI